MLSSYIAVALLCTSARALVFPSVPVATRVSPNANVDAPRPTDPPPFAELVRRQASSSQQTYSALIGPDNTCGYFDGLAGAAFTCNGAFTCDMLLPISSGVWGNMACCNSEICGVRNTCIDAVQYTVSSLCDNGCAKDTYTLKCTASSAPYCNSLRFSSISVEDYFCDVTSVSSWQPILTTYIGESGRSFSTTSFTLDESTTTSGSSTITSRIGSSTNLILNTSVNPSSASASAGAGAATSTTATPSPTAQPSSGGSSTPTGAIVGGVVGGVGGLALVAAAIWFFCIRKKRQSDTAVPVGNAQAPPTYASPQQNHDSAFYGGKPPMQQGQYLDPVTGQPVMHPQQQQMQQNQHPQNQNWGGNQQQNHGQYGAMGMAAGVGAGAGMMSGQKPGHMSEIDGHQINNLSPNPNGTNPSSGPASPMSESGRVVSGTVSDMGSPTLSHANVGGMSSVSPGPHSPGVPSNGGDIHEMSATSGPIAHELDGHYH